ncbi:hypothetical protein Pfo_019866 [Paulownia fortunei]|nr:hypothetical protein Pfo_019866 [Paulownia fortunei]
MEFLDKLWDETLAGPTPDSGLGKLRKYKSFSASSAAAAPPRVVSPLQDDNHPIPVSGGITVLRSSAHPSLSVSVDSPSVPSSPSVSSAPSSPFSPSSPGVNFKKLTRRKSTSAALPNSESKSPTGYDWLVFSLTSMTPFIVFAHQSFKNAIFKKFRILSLNPTNLLVKSKIVYKITVKFFN